MPAPPALVRRPSARTARPRRRRSSGQGPGSWLRSRRRAPGRRRCRRRPGQPRPRLRALALPRGSGRRVPPAGAARTEPLLRRPRHPCRSPAREHQVQDAGLSAHPRLLREPGVHRQRVRQLARRHARRDAPRQIRPTGRVQRVGAGRRQRSEKACRCSARGCRAPPSTGARPTTRTPACPGSRCTTSSCQSASYWPPRPMWPCFAAADWPGARVPVFTSMWPYVASCSSGRFLSSHVGFSKRNR